jgi:4-amino-4-deoxychorismate lyase
VTRGSGGRGYRPPAEVKITRVLLRYPWPDYPAAWAETGIELRICRTRLGSNPLLAGMKHLNRLEQVLARAEWTEGAAEGLMLDAEGHVVEGTMTNVFASRQGLLVTPALDQAGVAGVTRRHILENVEREGISVRVRRLSLDEFLNSEEIFVCNSIAGVWPVNRVESRRYAVGPMTRLAQRWAGQG